MALSDSQSFLRELDKKLGTAADRLRSNLDTAVYSRAQRDSQPRAARRVDVVASSNHAVLGLIFLKYVSDSFAGRQAEIEAMLKDPKHDFHLAPRDYGSPVLYEEAIRQELEERDYYTGKNVFRVPALARWKTLQDSAKLATGRGAKSRLGSSASSDPDNSGDDRMLEEPFVYGTARAEKPATEEEAAAAFISIAKKMPNSKMLEAIRELTDSGQHKFARILTEIALERLPSQP